MYFQWRFPMDFMPSSLIQCIVTRIVQGIFNCIFQWIVMFVLVRSGVKYFALIAVHRRGAAGDRDDDLAYAAHAQDRLAGLVRRARRRRDARRVDGQRAAAAVLLRLPQRGHGRAPRGLPIGLFILVKSKKEDMI